MSDTGLRALERLTKSPVSELEKGIPSSETDLTLGEIGKRGWNILRGDVPLPVAVLRKSAIEANRAWMRHFVTSTGALLAPHGKTTMSPQLFGLQVEDGAWGLTAATVDQLAVYRAFGHQRILLANQLFGRANMAYVLDELWRDPHFEFFCLVDTVKGAEALADAVSSHPLDRPVQVLIELGVDGGRTGIRRLHDAIELARCIDNRSESLSLRGAECYEGVIPQSTHERREREVRRLFRKTVDFVEECDDKGLFAGEPIYVSCAGSEYYDLAVQEVTARDERVKLVIRSGCYITQDDLFYSRAFDRLLSRSPELAVAPQTPKPALEVWGCVHSIPEPGLAILSTGKRDLSFDFEMPVLNKYYRSGLMLEPEELDQHEVFHLNDQHAYCALPATSPLETGDLVALGISHPCTTFDKWRILQVVDDSYTVIGAVKTFF